MAELDSMKVPKVCAQTRRCARASLILGSLFVGILGCEGARPKPRLLAYEYEFQRARNGENASLNLEEIYRREVKYSRILSDAIEELHREQKGLIEESQARERNLESLRQEQEALNATLAKVQEQKKALDESVAQTEQEIAVLNQRQSEHQVQLANFNEVSKSWDSVKAEAEASYIKSKQEIEAMILQLRQILDRPLEEPPKSEEEESPESKKPESKKEESPGSDDEASSDERQEESPDEQKGEVESSSENESDG